MYKINLRGFTLIVLLLLGASPAYALRLEPAAEAPLIVHAGAALLLILHIGGGALGLISGLVATLAPKGQRVHVMAGRIFFIAMFVCYLIGALVAPFLPESQGPNFVAGILALYLLVSGVRTARFKVMVANRETLVGLFVALTIMGIGLVFMYLGSQSESGTLGNTPPEAFILFVLVGAIAAIGEVHVLLKKKLSNNSRITRHLWRMCMSFFIASGSLFFGQPQLFSESFNTSIFPTLFALYPILIMLAWGLKTAFFNPRQKSSAMINPMSKVDTVK